MSKEEVLYVDPLQIKPGDNARFGLKRNRLDKLKESIADLGGIQEPITVIELSDGEYELVKGFYRHQAALELNEAGANIMVPVIVRSFTDPVERVRKQLAENTEREIFRRCLITLNSEPVI